MKAALLQMTSGIDAAANAQTLADAIATAGSRGVDALFAPEMSGLLDRDRERSASRIVTEADSPVLDAVRNAAAAAGVWVHLGSLPLLSETGTGRRVNRSLVIDSAGAIVARYDKIHRFDVDLASGEAWRESAIYDAGDKAIAVDTPWGRLGLAICYDLRFPALFEALGRARCDMIALPSAFTVPTGRAHWEVLLRARAIESSCFIIAAAQTGLHADDRETWGHSLVVDPWGEVVHDSGREAGLALVDIALARVAEVRAQIPALDHRRAIGDVTIA